MSDERVNLKSLTGLRGFAALAVVISHFDSYGLSNLVEYEGVGTVAVAMFFSLSGFLMGLLYLNGAFNTTEVSKYIVSRVSRVAPAYLTVVVFSFVIYTFFDHAYPLAIGIENLARHLLFSGNQGVLWSIPPEMQFYAFFIFVWYSISELKHGRLTPFYLLVAFISVIFLFAESFAGTVVFSKISYFIFGVFAGHVRLVYFKYVIPNNTVLFIQVALLASFIYILLRGIGYDNDEYWSNISNAIFVSFVVFIFSISTAMTRIAFENEAVMKMGEWSFSLYLTHVVVIYYISPFLSRDYLGSIIAIAAAVITSAVFYYLVEKKGVKFTRRLLSRILTKN